MVNDKDCYTREELWRNSVTSFKDVQRVIPDATHWKRNVVIALIIALPLLIIAVAAFLDGL